MFLSLLSLVYLLFFLLGFVHPFYWFSEFVPFRVFFSSHFCLPVCSCWVFHSAGCKVVFFAKFLFNDLRFFGGYWFFGRLLALLFSCSGLTKFVIPGFSLLRLHFLNRIPCLRAQINGQL